ncbi:MAG: Asp-tRNA(Asn)/Glu-tRNA(Gln) amidotransferase subunit GatC [Candidatus Krumholzibacteriota bacterium]|nr:Asp-tRNA(Asn)/Glu-tRNA(Gln) amidotransferase subunit GatC [Candidatus Krumholzibacteriota bacterium]
MAFSDDDLRHIEKLASIRLDADSRERLRGQLERIIGFVRRLEEVDATDWEPRAHVGRFRPDLRTDAVEPCLSRDEVLAAAPEREAGFFRVPPVIGSEEP